MTPFLSRRAAARHGCCNIGLGCPVGPAGWEGCNRTRVGGRESGMVVRCQWKCVVREATSRRQERRVSIRTHGRARPRRLPKHSLRHTTVPYVCGRVGISDATRGVRPCGALKVASRRLLTARYAHFNAHFWCRRGRAGVGSVRNSWRGCPAIMPCQLIDSRAVCQRYRPVAAVGRAIVP